MIQLSTFFQWELIFVRHYVRMWFTSCMVVGLDRYSRGAFLGVDSNQLKRSLTYKRGFKRFQINSHRKSGLWLVHVCMLCLPSTVDIVEIETRN
jgi:hypothetical protein